LKAVSLIRLTVDGIVIAQIWRNFANTSYHNCPN
jgi:hypothetical protein